MQNTPAKKPAATDRVRMSRMAARAMKLKLREMMRRSDQARRAKRPPEALGQTRTDLGRLKRMKSDLEKLM